MQGLEERTDSSCSVVLLVGKKSKNSICITCVGVQCYSGFVLGGHQFTLVFTSLVLLEFNFIFKLFVMRANFKLQVVRNLYTVPVFVFISVASSVWPCP